MAARLISAAVGIAVLFAVVLSGSMKVLTIAILICALLGMYELFHAFGFIKRPLMVVGGVIITAVLVLEAYIPEKFILCACFVYVLLLAVQLLAAHKEFKFSQMATAVFCAIYIPLSLMTILKVRAEEYGFWLMWIALGGAWVTDSFAYFSGRLFGKHKLCPLISPKKTVEGSVGGSLFTVIGGIVYGIILHNAKGIPVNFAALAAISLICAGVSQIGDLTASVIKREHGIKDYGKIMPGHGGFMDRFDSTLFVAPAVYIFNMIFTIFG